MNLGDERDGRRPNVTAYWVTVHGRETGKHLPVSAHKEVWHVDQD
jgi:hypothetical protein